MFSHAEEVAHYLQVRLKRRRIASVAYLILLAGYVVWRTTVLNEHAMVYSVVFLMADLLGALLGVSYVIQSWSIRVREAPPLDYRPKVDVFLPVYTEPAGMIELTVQGAVSIDYPHETWLLDDGKRDELKALAEKYGIRYLRRPTNQGAKAGNLNYALQHSRATAVAVFDADHIPKRESLDMLVGYLKDSRVAVAQTPQMFYNEDAFLYRDVVIGAGRWHEQLNFMDVIQSHRDLSDSSSCVGTGCVYSRAALDDIGGFPEATLTEDLHSSILFHKKGWKTVWVNEPVAWGVAASDVTEFYKTRRRWTYGNLQGFALEGIFGRCGLPLRQRIGYLLMAVDMLSGWTQLVYVLVPVISMVFFVSPFEPGVFTALMLILYPMLLAALLVVACAGYVRFFAGQVFSMGKLFMQIESTRGLFGKKMAWQISLKNVLGRVSWGKLAMHILLLVASVLAILAAVLRLTGVWGSDRPPDGGPWLLGLAALWVLVNCWRSWTWIHDSVRLTRRTHREYLFEVQLPILDENGAWIGHTRRLSTQQAEVNWKTRPQSGQRIQILTPGDCVMVQVKDVTGELMEMQCADDATRGRLQRSLYSVDWHRMVRLSGFMHATREKGLGGNWVPCLANGAWGLFLPAPSGFEHDRLLHASALVTGDEALLVIVGDRPCQRRLGNEVVPYRAIPRGLNNTAFRIHELR
ncbi:MAG: glycosyltransferase [Verrucomicrobiaceae bacterium]|nr:glycosyltransferase [Verrucomicrobiaceae bacterium]